MVNVLLLGATGTAGRALAKRLMNTLDCHVTLFPAMPVRCMPGHTM